MTKKINVEKEAGLGVQQTKCKTQSTICAKYNTVQVQCFEGCIVHCAMCGFVANFAPNKFITFNLIVWGFACICTNKHVAVAVLGLCFT